MKTIATTILLVSVLFFGCKTSEKLSKEEVITRITEKVENRNYTFVAQRAFPMGGRSINITYNYSLKVSNDTITAYLPYFGRAYTAPMSSDDNGIKFTSTDFEYSTSEKNKGMWDIRIKTNDNQKRYQLSLSIGEKGDATLNVQDTHRQAITFYGQIE